MVLLFCLALSFTGYSNDAKSIDSLEAIVKTSSNDKQRVDALYSISFIQAKSQSEDLITNIYKAQQLARAINYPEGIAKINLLLFETFNTNLGPDSVSYILLEAERNFELAELSNMAAQTINKLGIYYERQGKYKLAINCYYKALFKFQKLNDTEGIANEKNNIGLIHQFKKNYAGAIYFFNQAMEIGKELKDENILANAYNNLAICYQEEKQAEKALHYFELVYEIDKRQNITENLCLSYNNLGVIKTDLGDYAEAKRFLFMAIKAKMSIGDYTGLSNTYNNIASVYSLTKKPDSAIYYLNLAIKDAKSTSDIPSLIESYKIYGDLMISKGDYQKAYYYRSIRGDLQDSLSSAENTQVLSDLESDFQDLEKEKVNLEVRTEEEKTSMKSWLFFLGVLISGLVIAFLIFYLVRVRKAFKHLQIKQRKIEVQNKILQVKNIEIVQAKEAAEEAANIKSQFISTISHEIRTPLNAIIGVANLLQLGNPKPDQMDNLNILKISSENLLQLVNNILDFSKLEAGKLQLENIDFNLRSLVFDVKDLFSIKAMEKNVELLINFDEKIPSVLKGDPLRINQLLINLVNNAIKFTDSGYVKIDLSVQLTTINHALIHFSVSDSGIGIPSSKQSQIFQSFTQADSNTTRKFGGTGLGLSICKRILENLNSKLQLESVVGKGSRFYFTINFEVSRNASIGKSSRTASFEDSIKGKRVLVVEDNMMNIMVIRQFLQKWGVVTEIALNGREGVNRLQESNFDAILMDIHMPEMDGIEATKIIRKMTDERKRNVPIIALTAENEMQFRQRVYEVGMNDYIFKPFNPDDLRERLGYALYNTNGGGRFTP